jgi:hypothetical protein
MLGVLVSTVVSHLVTRNGRPIGQMKSEWGADTAKHWRYCILTTNYLISQTWRAGSFLSSELMNIWFIYGFEDRDEFAFKMIIVLKILSEALKQTECFFNFPFFFSQIFWFHISGPKKKILERRNIFCTPIFNYFKILGFSQKNKSQNSLKNLLTLKKSPGTRDCPTTIAHVGVCMVLACSGGGDQNL